MGTAGCGQDDRMPLFAGAIRQGKQFAGLRFQCPKLAEFEWHVAGQDFKLGVSMLFIGREMEGDVMNDDMGHLSIADGDLLFQYVIGQLRLVSSQKTTGFLSGSQPKGHLGTGLQAVWSGGSMQETAGGSWTCAIVATAGFGRIEGLGAHP